MDAMVPNHQAEEKETKLTKGNRKRLKRKQNDETNMETTDGDHRKKSENSKPRERTRTENILKRDVERYSRID
jgi:hypothetical protein